MAVGAPLGLKPGHTSSIRRIEAGMLSYHADMTLANNPFELRMDRLVNLDMEADFVSKAALKKISQQGVEQYFVGLEIEGPPLVGSNDAHYPILHQERKIGALNSAVFSPRLNKNIALAMIETGLSGVGTRLHTSINNEQRTCMVVPIPFYDPTKSLAAKS